MEAQAGIAPAHNWFAISRVSASPLGQYSHAIIFPMITDQDITKLKGVFATKEALADLTLEVGELHDKIDSIGVKIDGLTGLISASLEEHAAGAVAIARHTRQIKSLAVHTGATLPD